MFLFYDLIVIFSLLFVTFFAQFTVGNTLVSDEVEALKKIGDTLGKKWNFSVDPCSGDSGWILPIDEPTGFTSNVTCDNCTLPTNATDDVPVCHVVSIMLKAQNLSGTLPKTLVDLPYLQQFDVTRNYLNGTIPPEWGSTKLVILSVASNRLTGEIPKEIGNISTLKTLSVEINQLSGVVPGELGKLTQIERMLLTSNYFTGELNDSFAGLTLLKDFWISDNRFTGKIPTFITKWTNLTGLVIQASGMSGPIPSDIGLLVNMEDLRISDINGTESPFPKIDSMINLQTLMLRSCNMVGELPDYLGTMTKMITIDLSFNKLQGKIPESYSSLISTERIFLTGNSLSGGVPPWMLSGQGNHIDLSYNNFTDPNVDTCPRTVNLFRSSLKRNSTGISCLSEEVCPKQPSYFFHINCGGSKRITEGKITYEPDSSEAEASTFHEQIGSSWGYSSTGFFTDDGHKKDLYILANSSSLSGPLYTDARLSPLSLTYYGFCMVNGNYTVKLHFAEIQFTNDNSYFSLGRRMFDVYIQGTLILKDFNIEEAAGGAGKKVIINKTAIVTDNTLEIRFYWAGKGTTGVPLKGIYGPLVSAISVINPDYIPPKTSSGGVSTGIIIGHVAGVAIFILLALALVLLWKICLRRKELDNDLRGMDLQTGSFTLRQIKAATNNFDIANKIGEGGFGIVYKGILSDGIVIAVKQLSSKSKQGSREFVNEIGMISALQHPHLVKLHGCCIEGNQLLLVYEYMENNCLSRALFGPEESQLNLDWPTRHKICVGIARGLAYLHEESRLKIVHRDVKASNVLLDGNLDPKLSDFGLAKLVEEDNTHISTRIAGTYGYMAPEYAMRGYLTDKADVYSFGIVALEIVSGRANASIKSKENSFYLLDWAMALKQQGREMELIDPKLENVYNKDEVITMINVALLCTNLSPALRPSMSTVVSMLEGKATVTEVASNPPSLSSYNDMDHMSMENQNQYNQEQSLAQSSADLYPINPNSDYWKSRSST